MGSNSHDALEAAFLEFIKRCRVVGDRIVVEGDPTAPGHRLPNRPVRGTIDECLVCGEEGAHGGLQCPRTNTVSDYLQTGKPDWKRGQ